MADELAQSIAPSNELPTPDQNGSEAGKTPETTSEVEGIKNEMLRERRARQDLEAAMNDPYQVYQMAVRHNLYEAPADAPAEPEEKPAKSDAKPRIQPPAAPSAAQIQAMVAAQLDYDRTVDKYPELASNARLNRMFQSLATTGMRWSEAATEIMDTIDTTKATAKSEGAKQAETRVSEKEAASATTSTVSTTSDAADLEALNRRTKSLNRQTQESALVEKLLRQRPTH